MRATFGTFELDTERHELRKNGELLRLSPKAFGLLTVLVEKAPEAVTRDELYQCLWSGTFVEDVNLSNLISDLREILGDSASRSRYIRTIHGVGYSFISELQVHQKKSTRPSSGFLLVWKQHEYPLNEGRNVIGRHESSDVVIPLSAVSRSHASIDVDGTTITIRDLGSKNGVFVDDELVQDVAIVTAGMQIRIGTVLVMIREASLTETTHTAVS